MGLTVLTLDDPTREPETPDGVCPECKGFGMVRQDLPVDHPDFGRLVPCPAEHHARQRYHDLLSRSGLKGHEHHVLDDILGLDDAATEMVNVARQFLAKPKGWLYLWGGVGTAKSLALMALVHEFIKLGKEAYYTTLSDLLDVVREAFTEPNKRRTEDEDGWRRHDTYRSRFQRLCRVNLLALDEFDAEKINETDFVSQFRFQLLDQRYRDALGQKTVTVFAGNDDPKSLPPWIWDRIDDGRFQTFHHTGRSARPQMRWWQQKYNGEGD